MSTVLALTACGSGDAADDQRAATTAPTTTIATSFVDAPDDAAPDATTVTISRSRFDHLELRVPAGTTVTFVNDDPFAHTVTSTDDSPMRFDSGDLGEGGAFEVTFDQPGEFPYFCQIHPTMRAIVVVE